MPEYGPEQGEQAEPIAMGRQTIWGGRGRPPSREVMSAAATNARGEMMQRIREKNASSPNGGGGGGGRGRPAAGGRPSHGGGGSGTGAPRPAGSGRPAPRANAGRPSSGGRPRPSGAAPARAAR